MSQAARYIKERRIDVAIGALRHHSEPVGDGRPLPRRSAGNAATVPPQEAVVDIKVVHAEGETRCRDRPREGGHHRRGARAEAIMEELRIEEVGSASEGSGRGSWSITSPASKAPPTPWAGASGRPASCSWAARARSTKATPPPWSAWRCRCSTRPARPACTAWGTRSGSSCATPPTFMTWATSSRSPITTSIPTTSSGTPTSWASTRGRWPSWPPWPATTARGPPAARTRSWQGWTRRPTVP